MSLKTAFTLLNTLGVASAHTIMQAISVGGTTYPQGAGIYMPSDNSFIADVTSDSLACNGAPVSGFSSSRQVIEVNAGDTVTGAWLHTLTSTGADESADNKVLASSHKGPVLAYMKKVDDAAENPSNAPGDGWFKVAEAGLISADEWAVDQLIANEGLQSVTIPACIEDGDYLLRFEIIALHSAGSVGGAQFYMECAQLRVSGGSAAVSPRTYAIPGIYSATDPGIEVSIYNGNGQPYPDSYTIPGPSLFTCSGAGSSPGSAPGNEADDTDTEAGNEETAAPVTSAVPVTSAAPTSIATQPATTPQETTAPAQETNTQPPTSGGGAAAAKYMQCGGNGYNGPTVCEEGSTCNEVNKWYSQCL